MSSNIEIRKSQPGDTAEIERLYIDAFPDDDLLPLVKELLYLGQDAISLVGVLDSAIVGHACFTICRIEESSHEVALLGPLVVAPALHGQGEAR
ncbi:MAG: hypothetical protein OEX17_01075 [Rhodospirillaceae bacterium]|nr:hypothetical protein [Rhodospirillaceae bacterium]